jgi:hypothetical protein
MHGTQNIKFAMTCFHLSVAVQAGRVQFHQVFNKLKPHSVLHDHGMVDESQDKLQF